MMSHRKRSGENSTCFSIFLLTIAEKQRIRSRIIMSHMTSLSHKTASHHRAILYVRTTGDNKIITYHSVTDMYWIVSITVNTTVLQSASSLYFTIVTDTHIFNISRIDNRNVRTYRSSIRSMFVCISLNQRFHTLNELRTMTVKCHNICLMCRKTVMNHNLTTSCFIQDRHLYPISKTRFPVYQNNIHILDKCICPNLIVSNVILYIFNATVISHCHIMQSHIR